MTRERDEEVVHHDGSPIAGAASFWGGFPEAASVLKSLSRELQVLKHSCGPEMTEHTALLLPVIDLDLVFSVKVIGAVPPSQH